MANVKSTNVSARKLVVLLYKNDFFETAFGTSVSILN